MGYLPTVLCGIFFTWYIAPFVAYISINIGSLINILIIKYIILRNKHRCCIGHILRCCCGKKFGQVSFLKKLFIATSNPIKIVILLRLPYLNNGVVNYLFSLQVDSLTIKQNLFGNLIGFIPGSIIFSIFGQEIKNIATIISNRGFENKKQMILNITIVVITIICYLLIVWKVKSLIKSGTKSIHKANIIINNNDDDDDDGQTNEQHPNPENDQQYVD